MNREEFITLVWIVVFSVMCGWNTLKVDRHLQDFEIYKLEHRINVQSFATQVEAQLRKTNAAVARISRHSHQPSGKKKR